MKTKKQLIENLPDGYFPFGNKGNVWSNELHAAKSGFNGTTLCGVPMLSFNYATGSDLKEIGCKKCHEILNKLNSETARAL